MREQTEAQALRLRIRANCCIDHGMTRDEYERHIEGIAQTIERARDRRESYERMIESFERDDLAPMHRWHRGTT